MFDKETAVEDNDVSAPTENTEILLVNKEGQTVVVDKKTGEIKNGLTLEEVTIGHFPTPEFTKEQQAERKRIGGW